MGTDAHEQAFRVVEEVADSSAQAIALLTELPAELEATFAGVDAKLGLAAVNRNHQHNRLLAELTEECNTTFARIDSQLHDLDAVKCNGQGESETAATQPPSGSADNPIINKK